MPYTSVRDLWLRTGLEPSVIERLADADAFGSIGLRRRDALWAAKALGRVGDKDDDLPLFRAAALSTCAGALPPPLRGRVGEEGKQQMQSLPLTPLPLKGGGKKEIDGEREVHLPPMPLGEEVVNDYRFLKLSLKAHPAAFLRAELQRRGIVRNDDLRRRKSGERLTVSGLVTCRQRPGSAQGVVFMTIEDETALANIIIWPKMLERFRPIVLGARYVAVSGPMQEEQGVIHVVADRIEDLTPWLARLAQDGTDLESLTRCDEVKRPGQDHREKGSRTVQHRRLAALLTDMPELINDLDVPARGTAHAPGRRSR